MAPDSATKAPSQGLHHTSGFAPCSRCSYTMGCMRRQRIPESRCGSFVESNVPGAAHHAIAMPIELPCRVIKRNPRHAFIAGRGKPGQNFILAPRRTVVVRIGLRRRVGDTGGNIGREVGAQMVERELVPPRRADDDSHLREISHHPFKAWNMAEKMLDRRRHPFELRMQHPIEVEEQEHACRIGIIIDAECRSLAP